MTTELPRDIDHEVLAQQMSSLGGKVIQLENRVSDLLFRLAEIEKVYARLEQAALTTARTLAELSGHRIRENSHREPATRKRDLVDNSPEGEELPRRSV